MERIKNVGVSMQEVAGMLKKHYDLPPDAMYMGGYYDEATKRLYIQFKHQTFDLVDKPKDITKEKPLEVLIASETSNDNES